MQKSSLYLTVILLVSIVAAFNSCTKKSNGIDNNQVIQTPYSLFFSDTSGGLFNSNDGKIIQHTLFKGDGFPSRAICTVNENILWAKTNLYFSTNNGTNFNHSFDSLPSYPFNSCSGVPLNLNQSMIINIPDWGHVYIVSQDPDPGNFLKVQYSQNVGGERGSWWNDLPDTNGNIGAYGNPDYEISMTSFTLLTNNVLCGYDAVHNRNFYKMKGTYWFEVTANPDSFTTPYIGSPRNHTGITLPYCFRPPASDPGQAWYSYGHLNNRLIAIDNRNCQGGGGYWSDDTGRNWTRYAGLPDAPLLCVSSPFEEICLVGTHGAGLYELNTNTGAFQQQTNNGLGTNIVVRNIAAKENVYKNGKHEKFVYLATNQGIYQSTDGGHKWTKTIPGNFVTIY